MIKSKKIEEGRIMDFINISDWFGREGPFLYAPEYLCFFALVALMAIILPVWLRKKSPKTVRNVLIALWIFATVYDIIRWSAGWIDTAINQSEFSIGAHLPLHTCSTVWYIFPLAVFPKNEKLREAAASFLCTINLFGGIVGMTLGTAMMSCYSLFSFYGMEFMIYHAIVVIIPIIMMGTGFYRPEGNGYLKGFYVFLAIAIPVFIFNNIFAVDYMYTYDSSTLPIFKPISDMLPHRLIWTLISLVGYFLISVLLHYLPIGIRTLYKKVKKA